MTAREPGDTTNLSHYGEAALPWVEVQVTTADSIAGVVVRDSGPGLQPGGEVTNAGIGLSNTEARLRTIFGDRHRFELINDNGLSVNLRLPLPMLTSVEEKAP